VRFGYLVKARPTVTGDKFLGCRIDGRGSTLGKFHFVFSAQIAQSRDKFIARQYGRGGDGEVCLRFVALHKLDSSSQLHQRVGDHAFVMRKLITDGAHRRRIHAMGEGHQILDDAGMAPCQKSVDTFHFRVKPVIGLVANRDHGVEAAGCVANQLRQFGNAPVAADVLGIPDAGGLPGRDHGGVDVNARNAQRPEKIPLAAFIHADAGREQFGIQNSLVAEFDFLEDFRLQDKFDKLLRALALHNQLAAFVEDDVGLFLLARKPRVGHLAKFEIIAAQVFLKGGRLGVGQFASVDGQRLHAAKNSSTRSENKYLIWAVAPPISRIARKLVAWFGQSARNLPWRRSRDPYAIWISEIMLQQTQVKTVIPYYERWMRTLPTVQDFAAARPEKVLKLWEGLGYYTRVGNAQSAARLIMAEHAGRFPARFDDILALPGIGRYTAGAISSIAFNQPAPILDGNVIRVLTRLFGIAGDPRGREVNAKLWDTAEKLVSTRELEPAKLNQALMELGALICLARQPRCVDCPVRQHCIARRQGRVALFPATARRRPVTERRFIALVVREQDRFLVRPRAAGVVNAGLWEFPNFEIPVKTKNPAALAAPFETAAGRRFFSVRHSITRYRILLEAFHATKPAEAEVDGVWKTIAQMSRLPFTSAHRKVLNAARRAGRLTKRR